MTEEYFFDTYAIFEIIGGNKSYEKYINKPAILTKLNIFELFHNALRDTGEKKANNIMDEYYPLAIDYDRSAIEEASRLKLKYKKRNLSMTDCIGYIIAKKLGIKFLTGDKEFEDLDNVEFVK